MLLYDRWMILLTDFGRLDDKCKQSLIEPEAFTIYLCENLESFKKRKKNTERTQVSPKIPVQ